jgi:hypothetical protein
VDLVLHKFVGSLQKLGGEDDDGGSTITNFSILDLGELNEHLSGGVSDFQLLKNCGAVICDGHISDIVDKHLVETLRTE